jgi:hypothetical protein
LNKSVARAKGTFLFSSKDTMAFNTNSTTQIGTKGSDVYTAVGVEDPRVALSVLLTRGADTRTIRSGIDAILKMADANQAVKDLFVMAFQTRDVRGGKGERAVAYEMFKYLLDNRQYSSLASDLLDLIPEYGSWRDLFQIAQTHATDRVMNITEHQFYKDKVTMAGGKVSLMAKHAPREDKYPDQFKLLANRIFADEPKFSRRLRALRQALSAMNKVSKTVEIQMCDKHFADIKPEEVPGRALQKYTKAFLNQPSTFRNADHVRPSADPDRVACAEHFTEHFAKAAKGEAKLNGSKTVFPHELIKKVVSSIGQSYYGGRRYFLDDATDMDDSMTREEKDAIIGVWNQMVKDAKEGGGLGRSLAMCDFSGSMQSSGSNGDTPYWVSMAMGLLISEVTTKEFEDVFLTFDSTPTFHHLPKGDIFKRVSSIHGGLAQGTSTDFQKAMDLVLQRCKAMRVRPGEEPENLIVLTDMNWDQACGSNQASLYTSNRYRHVVKTDDWQTHVEMIRESFKRAGEDMWGEGQGLKMPRIVIWNIAATSADFHAKADTEGVVMLSGWSPSLFKVLQKEGVVIQTPYAALRAQLDDERYDPIRARVEAWFAKGVGKL